MSAARRYAESDRRAMTAKLHIARKDLALADDSYRAILERVAGRASSKDCSPAQLHAVLEEFKRLGWKARPPRRARKAAAPTPARAIALDEQASKVRALWLSLWCLGETEDASEEAIEAFAARTTRTAANPEGIARLQWLDAPGYDRVIRALRGWCGRIGFPQPTAADVARINAIRASARHEPASYGLVCKIVLFGVLWTRLANAGPEAGGFRHGILARQDTFIRRFNPRIVSPEFLDEACADAACRELGQWWRRVKDKPADG